MSSKNKASISVVCGGSGTGKSAWVKRRLTTVKRLVIWDMTGEYAREGIATPVDKCAALVQHLQAAGKKGACRVAFQPQSAAAPLFNLFCRAAYAFGNCVVVVEELADVTTPGKAPPGWGVVVRRGRHKGLTVYGVTQRPSESDKTIMGNATLVHVCKMKRAQDRAYMAREISADVAELDSLLPLEWIEVTDDGKRTRGKLVF